MEINLKKVIAKSFKDLWKDVSNHNHTHYWLKGGRGSTKSSFVTTAIPLLIMHDNDVHAVVVRKVASTLKNSVYNQMIWSIDNMGLGSLFKVYKTPLKIVYRPTGQEILFLGCDDPLKVKGTTVPFGRIGIVYYEELDQFYGMEEIRSMTQSFIRKDGKAWIFYAYNPPKSRNNWVNEEVLVPRKDRLIHHSTYIDVPTEWLGEQFIIEAEHLRDTNIKSYNHEYLGEVTGTGGSIFENIEVREITDEEIKVMDKFYYGIDFGFAIDPLAWGKQYFHNNTLYIIDELYEYGLTNKDLSIKLKQKKINREIQTADSAEPKSIHELKSYGLNVIGAKKGQDSVEYGIKWLQSLDKIVIDPKRTPNAYSEFVRYEYERTKDGSFISRYPDKNNHFIDQVRYACESIMKRRGNLSNRRL